MIVHLFQLKYAGQEMSSFLGDTRVQPETSKEIHRVHFKLGGLSRLCLNNFHFCCDVWVNMFNNYILWLHGMHNYIYLPVNVTFLRRSIQPAEIFMKNKQIGPWLYIPTSYNVFAQWRAGASPLPRGLPNAIHWWLSCSHKKEIPLASSYLMSALLLSPHFV